MNERSYEGIRDVKALQLWGKGTSLCWAQRNASALGETAVHRVLEAVGGEETLQHLAELRFPLVGWLRLAAPSVEIVVHCAVGREIGPSPQAVGFRPVHALGDEGVAEAVDELLPRKHILLRHAVGAPLREKNFTILLLATIAWGCKSQKKSKYF